MRAITAPHWQHKYKKIKIKTSVFQIIWNVALTYLCVLLALVFFRASSVTNALDLLNSAVGMNGFGWLPDNISAYLGLKNLPGNHAFVTIDNVYRIGLSLLLIWFCPNSQQILGRYAPILEKINPGPLVWIRWKPTILWAGILCILLYGCLFSLNQSTTFIYFEF